MLKPIKLANNHFLSSLDMSSDEVFNILEIAPKLVSGLHSPMPSAKHLESTVIPQKEDILNAIQDML